jgi:hypothetical protein
MRYEVESSHIRHRIVDDDYTTDDYAHSGAGDAATLESPDVTLSQQQYTRWAVLWACFLLTMLYALWQRLRSSPQQSVDQEGRTGAAEKTRRMVRGCRGSIFYGPLRGCGQCQQSCEYFFGILWNLNDAILFF